MTKKVRANTNIALIKYWGKKDDELRIPHNSSLSLTLDNLYTETTVTYHPELLKDEFYLDGKIQEGQTLLRVVEFMDYVRKTYGINKYAKIDSYNHVPSAAGLASSASAFAALAKASTLDLNLGDDELSRLARMGSGSASRSIYGGFVEWKKGDNHENSIAVPLENSEWPEIRMIVCFVNEGKKPFSSSEAMKETVEDSVYYEAWVKQSEIDIKDAKTHIMNQDIVSLGKLVQSNALRMHASLMAIDKWYFEPDTIEIMNIVRNLQKKIPVYFTMDAGPNVKLLTLEKYVDQVLEYFTDYKTLVSKSGSGMSVSDD